MKKEQWELIKNFKREEFMCKCGCEREEMDYYFMLFLDGMRNALGFPLIIESGCRCEKHNSSEQVGGKEFSSHIKKPCKCADIRCLHSLTRAKIITYCIRKKNIIRIGVYKTFLHIDIDETQPNPRIW